MERLDYFLKRFLLIFPTFLCITFICFAICQFVPGGPVDQAIMRMKGMGGDTNPSNNNSGISEEQRKALEEHFGFNQPIHKRYWKWAWTNRIGLRMESYKFPNKTAWQLVKERFAVSLIFGIPGFFLTYLVCIPLGIAKALRDGKAFDVVSSLIVFVGYAIPAFAFGMILKMLFCGTVDQLWDWFPVAGFVSDNYDSLTKIGKIKDMAHHMFLPVLCYMIGNFAVLTLLMKNSLLEEISKDYVRTVLAKGGTYGRAVWLHAVRNSLIPIVTGIGGIMTIMFAGSVLIEQVFEIPGMGRLSLEAITSRDYPVFMCILAVTSILGLVGNIVSDLSYVLIDPRINFRK